MGRARPLPREQLCIGQLGAPPDSRAPIGRERPTPGEGSEAESGIGGPAVPSRGRALRPPLRPHYGGAHAAHRVAGARRGLPRLPPPPAPPPPPSRPRQAGRRLPPASLSAAVRACPVRVGARESPRLTVAAPTLPAARGPRVFALVLRRVGSRHGLAVSE